jgi:hypothetical protein
VINFSSTLKFKGVQKSLKADYHVLDSQVPQPIFIGNETLNRIGIELQHKDTPLTRAVMASVLRDAQYEQVVQDSKQTLSLSADQVKFLLENHQYLNQQATDEAVEKTLDGIRKL